MPSRNTLWLVAVAMLVSLTGCSDEPSGGSFGEPFGGPESVVAADDAANTATGGAFGEEAPVTTTKAGRLRGFAHAEQDVLVFLGVHYGASTAGAGRFRPPRPAAAWEGVQDATRFGDTCPQGGTVGRSTREEGQLLPHSEDCLVLNVWTPALDDGARPVMVWFHGRGFYAGAGSEPLYDGARLADRGDLVVVTVNHRLNVFGYLELGKVGGQAFAGSGNAGVMDMELALRWVADNIAEFGGDPGNVTIFGESGGGVKVATLLGVSAAKGLFHRGIIQSGARRTGIPLAAAEENAATVMDRLGVETVEALQAVPFEELLAAVTTTGRTDPAFGPVVDGSYLPADMFDPVAAPTAHGVPIIVGDNRDEYLLYARGRENFGQMTEEEMRADLAGAYGEDLETLLAAYRESRPGATPWDLWIAIRSSRFHVGTARLAEVAADVAPVYVYSFDFAPAGHGAEIRYVFANATASPEAPPGARAVEDAMSGAWIAFARTGSPNHPGIPEWPRYDAERRAVMVFDAETRVVNDPRAPERKVWDDVEPAR